MIYTSKMISEPDVFIDSANYMEEDLFSYLNTSTTDPIVNVEIEASPKDREVGDVSDIEVYNTVKQKVCKSFIHIICSRKKKIKAYGIGLVPLSVQWLVQPWQW